MSKYMKLYYIMPLTTLIIYLIGVWLTFDLKWFYFDIDNDIDRALFTLLILIKLYIDWRVYVELNERYI